MELLVEYAAEDGYNFRSASVATAEQIKLINVAMVAFGLLAGLAIAIVLARGISRPVTGMTGAMTALAGGDMTVEIPAIERKDEIGEMAKAVQVFRDNAVAAGRLGASQAEMERRQRELVEQRAAEKAKEEAREAAEAVKLAEAQAERQRHEREEEASRIKEKRETEEHQRREEVRRTEEKQENDLRARIERRQAMLGLADNFESQVGGVIETVTHASVQMQSSAQSMSVNAEQTSERSMTVASASDQASSTYERTVVSGEASFDRWIAGDEKAITVSAKRGFDLFNGKANCVSCHTGWNFTDDSFHDIGLGDADIGRGKVVENSIKMQHAFKTPTLRDVVLRGPYMHDGSLPNLGAVVEHYSTGSVQRPSLSDEIKPFALTKRDKADLVAFMLTLNGADQKVVIPRLPPYQPSLAEILSRMSPSAGPGAQSGGSSDDVGCKSARRHWLRCGY